MLLPRPDPACGLVTEGCLPGEVLMRFRLAISQGPPVTSRAAAAEGAEVVISISDESSRSLLRGRLEEHGLRWRLASNGPETILLLRHLRAPVAVVDVDMDGFETLAAIHAESMPVRTMFLTFSQQEDMILRGFSLGAEDYLVQPFSPVELAARLKRLLV
jgi:DNA-binding response OmpR family regulator